MREILFRGKTKTGKWAYGDLLQATEDKACLIVYMDNKRKCNYRDINPETVGQFTGLTDKNGTKIFEDDIVKVTYTEKRKSYGVKYDWEFNFIEQVIYGNEQACFMLKINNYGIIMYRPIYSFQEDIKIKEMEIIGNIHDNPELLKEQE